MHHVCVVNSNGECGVPVVARYKGASNDTLANGVFWYSFDYGPVRVVQISSEHNFEPGSVQYQWLERTLRSADPTVTPFTVLTAHRAMYNSENYTDDYAVCQGMQRAFDALLHEYQVDLMVVGHYHSVEVTLPVYQDRADPTGTVHATIGNSGADLDEAKRIVKDWWGFFNNKDFGFGRVTVSTDVMTLEIVRAADSSVMHTTTIPRKAKRPRIPR